MKNYVYCSMAFAFTILLSTRASADDWPRWMGANMDAVVNDAGLIEKFPETGPNVLWRQEIGAGYAGPSVVGEHVFVMDRIKDEGKGGPVENGIGNAGQIAGGERVQCLNIKTGEQVWEHTYDCAYKIAYPTGPRTTPAVDVENVYTLGAMGDLICFKKASGEIVWEKNIAEAYKAKPPVWGYSSHPLVDGDMLLVPVGGEGSAIVAFDKKTGKELWKAGTTLDIAYSPLVIYEKEVDGKPERQLIFWHADGVTSFDPKTGKQFWFAKFPEETSPSQTSIATPRIVGNKLFVSEFYKGSLLLEIESNPPGVKELRRSRNEDPRNQKSLNAMMATPAIKDGHAYGIGFDGRGNGVLRCIELESGEMKWSKDDWVGGKPLMFATAFMIQNRDKFYMFDDIGELIIAKMNPEGFEELDRAKLLEPTSVARGREVVWSHPAISNGLFFARNDKEIICVSLKN